MVLLLCMIFLTAMMLLGLSASSDAIVQTRLAANLQKTEQVKQSAQVALESAERWLLTLEGSANAVCQPPCSKPAIYPQGGFPDDIEYQPLSWWMGIGTPVATAVPSLQPPETGNHGSVWLIESIHSKADADHPDVLLSWYRVLARSSDPEDKMVSVVESIVLKPIPINGTTLPGEGMEPGVCNIQTGNCGRVAWRRLR